jgi:hypothetical protein
VHVACCKRREQYISSFYIVLFVVANFVNSTSSSLLVIQP